MYINIYMYIYMYTLHSKLADTACSCDTSQLSSWGYADKAIQFDSSF